MASPLKIGDHVVCQYFNDPERRFYGEPFTGTLVWIDEDQRRAERAHGYQPNCKPYLIRRRGADTIYLHRKEILRRLSPTR